MLEPARASSHRGVTRPDAQPGLTSSGAATEPPVGSTISSELTEGGVTS